MSDTVHDRCLRAMTHDGGFRVLTVRTTDTVRGVLAAQPCGPATARTLADLVTGTILVRETMSPSQRVQGVLHGAHKAGMLVADAHPDGGTRGLVQQRGDVDVTLGPGAALEMMRTLSRGVHRGVVAVPEGGDISTALMAYMQESEQVLSVIAVTSVFENDTLVAAGGYLVQTLPELSEAMLAIMTERLTHLAPIGELLRDARTSPDSLLDELLHAMPYARLADTPLHFACRCDVVRIMASLATLQRSDIQEMVNDAKPLEIRCDYCQKDYRIETEQLRGLLAES